MVTNRYSNTTGDYSTISIADLLIKKEALEGERFTLAAQIKASKTDLVLQGLAYWNKRYSDLSIEESNCQLARNNAGGTGAKKNKACHIDMLTSLSNMKKIAYDRLQIEKSSVNEKELRLIQVQKEIDAIVAEYNSKTGANLSSESPNPQVNNVINDSKNNQGIFGSAPKSKLLLYGGIGLGVIVLTFVGIRMLK
jgi:hypothetical protein